MAVESETGRPSPPSLDRELRVLQLLVDAAPGPASIAALAATRALTAAGVSVEASVADQASMLQFRRAGANLVAPPARGAGARWGPLGLGGQSGASAHVIAASGPAGAVSLVHAHGAAAAARASRSVRRAVSLYDVPPAASLARYTLRRALRDCTLFAPSAYLAGRLADMYHVSATVVPAGIDTDVFDAAAVSTARTIALAERWGLLEDPRPIILVPDAHGHPSWLKTILSAAAAGERDAALWILVAAPAERGQRVPELLERSGLASRIRWCADCDDWPAALKLTSLLVERPLATPTVCRRALEAQSIGKPVLLPLGGAAAESVPAQHQDALLPETSGAALAAAVARALARSGDAEALRRREARNFVVETHALPRLGHTLLASYRHAIST